MGFMHGDYFALSKKERQGRVLAQLVKIYGPQAAEPLAYNELVWRNEPYTYSSYVQGLVPHQNNGHPIYRRGYWGNRLYLGGSETASSHPGYMEGAVSSAYWLANQIIMKSVFFFFLVGFAFACGSGKPQTTVIAKHQIEQAPTKTFSAEARAVLAKALEAHGGDRYETAYYQFVFRDKAYKFKNNGSSYRYELIQEKQGVRTKDVLENGQLVRTAAGKPVELTDKQRRAISESLNSVIYFATLPHKLTDASVNLEYGGEVLIKDVKYETLNVTFDQEGGGVDHEDQYRYWVNVANGRIDYLAYNYRTGKGGVRFREAYNSRNVDGIVFQDYVNYKAPVGTPLDSLPLMLERLELEQLSLIETKAVAAIKS